LVFDSAHAVKGREESDILGARHLFPGRGRGQNVIHSDISDDKSSSFPKSGLIRFHKVG
jgi:hypothetical protein